MEWIAITMVNDTNSLLDEMSTKDHLLETNFPFWAELWPSAVALARYLWDNVDFQGEQVLELGCGLGLVGIVARKKQAKILMTDYNDDALMFARYNAMSLPLDSSKHQLEEALTSRKPLASVNSQGQQKINVKIFSFAVWIGNTQI